MVQAMETAAATIKMEILTAIIIQAITTGDITALLNAIQYNIAIEANF